MKRTRAIALAALLASSAMSSAAPAADVGTQIRQYRALHEREILTQFHDLLSLPNVATDQINIERNAEHIKEALEKRGFRTKLLRSEPGSPPSVYGELMQSGASRTAMFYAHYDGQPVAQKGWLSPPFVPVIHSEVAGDSPLDWRMMAKIDPSLRIFARSASDDKAPIQAMLTALDGLKAAGIPRSINVKVFYEGEEEQGSPHLSKILSANKDLLQSDVFILSDGPTHPSGAMQVFYGARGSSSLELTAYGPLHPLHDGHYGNWAPNPAVMLTHLLDSLRDQDGNVLIPEFYRDVRPLTAVERQAAARLPDVETGLKRHLALGRTETRERLANALARPALNVRGIRVGDVGDDAANVISTEARASIDFRLAPDQTPERVKDLTEAFLEREGWHIVHDDPDAAVRASHPRVVKLAWRLGYPAYRADMTAPAVRAVVRSVERSTGASAIQVPMLGGSSPMYHFAKILNTTVVGVPIANYDNNQHAANENIRIQNLWAAIDIYAGILAGLVWED